MLISPDRVVQPNVGTGAHWTMFTELRQHPDLFAPLSDGVVQEVNAAITNGANIDSSILGKRVLESVGSWWHGEFSRRCRDFPNGAAAGLCGMALWNYLAELPQDWWCFWAQEDRHGYGETHKLYTRLPPGSPMIPRGR